MTKIRVDIKRMMLLPATLMTLTAAGQNVSGQVVDAHGNGIPYINVVALSLPDSAYVTGVMTDSIGRFGFDVPPEGRLLRVSGVGYKTVMPTGQAMRDASVYKKTRRCLARWWSGAACRREAEGRCMVTNVWGRCWRRQEVWKICSTAYQMCRQTARK